MHFFSFFKLVVFVSLISTVFCFTQSPKQPRLFKYVIWKYYAFQTGNEFKLADHYIEILRDLTYYVSSFE